MAGQLDGKRVAILATNGFEQSELETPRDKLKAAGAQVDIVSPEQGEIKGWDLKDWGRPVKVDKQLGSVKADDYDAIVLPGGQINPDLLRVDQNALKLIKAFYDAGKPVAAVCHAPGVLRHAKTADGKPLVQGRQVTGFSNTEEAAVQLTAVVPFLVEDELAMLGGLYSKGADWQPHIVSDGLLITGQNPASSVGVAQALLERLKA